MTMLTTMYIMVAIIMLVITRLTTPNLVSSTLSGRILNKRYPSVG